MDMKLYKQLENEFSETHSGSYYPYQKDLWILIRHGQTRGYVPEYYAGDARLIEGDG